MAHGPARASAERFAMTVVTNVHTHQLQPLVWVFGKFLGLFGGYPNAYLDFYLYVVSCLQMRSSRFECVLQPDQHKAKIDQTTVCALLCYGLLCYGLLCFALLALLSHHTLRCISLLIGVGSDRRVVSQFCGQR